MLALSRQDIRQLVSMQDAIDLVKYAFLELKEGRAIVPLRLGVEPVEGRDSMLLMPAYLSDMPSLGFKMVNVFQENRSRDLPVINAVVFVVDPETGVPQAIMDGAYVTQLRTGAISGAATDFMARKDAKTLVVIGGGVQGVTQAAAVCTVRDIEKITVVDKFEDSFDRFRTNIENDWPDLADRLSFDTEAEAACREADIICCATTSKQPVFEDAWLKEGVHVNGVGSFTPEMHEVPSEFVAHARLITDMTEHAVAETGDLIIPMGEGLFGEDHILGELADLVDGSVAGRERDDEATFFKTVGNAVQDMSVATTAVNRALEQGIGQQFELG